MIDVENADEPPPDAGMDVDTIEDDRDLRQVIMLMAKDQRDKARETHDAILSLVGSLGHNGRRYRREATQRLRAVVAEVYSAPRVTDAARRHPRLGCIPGLALDITTTDDEGNQWNFDDPKMRAKAETLLDAQKPAILIGSPMCTPFSNLQNLNNPKRDPNIVAAEKAAGRRHLEWCCHLYRKQVERGAYFLHEHPAFATSWSEPCVIRTLQMKGVSRVRADQCQLGQQTLDGDPVKKPTGFMSNSQELLDELNRRCFGRNGLCSRPRGGVHRQCIGKVAQRAAVFQEELCLAILRGLKRQLRKDNRVKSGEVGIHEVMLTADDEIDAYYEAARGSDNSALASR